MSDLDYACADCHATYYGLKAAAGCCSKHTGAIPSEWITDQTENA